VIEDAAAYEFTGDGRTRVSLTLEPNGSVFVVFRRPGAGAKSSVRAEAKAAHPIAVDVPWTVRFTPGWGAPAEAAFPKLVSWSEHADPGIRYYSGTARYAATIELPAGAEALTLDLGEVRELAEVWLNGQPLGILWKKPFAVKLGAAAHAGANRLEIEVVNLWPNRLIGDQNLPEGKRFTKTNITKFTATSPLMPSGLLGPVTLR
jgi:hypothetical protein